MSPGASSVPASSEKNSHIGAVRAVTTLAIIFPGCTAFISSINTPHNVLVIPCTFS